MKYLSTFLLTVLITSIAFIALDLITVKDDLKHSIIIGLFAGVGAGGGVIFLKYYRQRKNKIS